MVAVAATDDRDQLAAFSNYGASSVHLGAPGVDIFSTTRNNTYSWFSGTSMATPHVSGTAVLVLSVCALDTAALKSNLLSNVDPIASLAGITTTGGRLNANKAIRACSAPPTGPPPAPTGLTASGGNAQVSLSWTGSAGATSYNVKRSTVSGGSYSNIATGVATTSYTDSTVTNGTTYYYVVSAVNSFGESPNSNQASATPQAPVGDFSLSATPSSSTVRRFASTTYTVQVTPSGGFSGTVTFSVSGLPGGASASFNPTSVTGGGSSTMTVTAGQSRGTFVLTISGTSGTLTRTTQVTLTVTK
jgi:cellulose 1,4-beta-cellobiosidase